MRRQWPRADVIEVGTAPHVYMEYARWRHPFTGKTFEMWGRTKVRAIRRAVHAWRLAVREYTDAVEQALR